MSFTKPEFPPVDPDTFLGLVGQQYLADPQRSVGNIHPVSAYAHVPNGYTGDATAAIIAQIERFGPGIPRPRHRPNHQHHQPIGRTQSQLRRRRYHDRRQGFPPVGIRSANHAVAVPHRCAGYVHLLGRHAARPRRRRYVRHPRRTSRT